MTAGTDVAFAYALLRCGGEDDFARDPDQRLRLTVGLRKVDGRWQVAHEHHSFADTSQGAGVRPARGSALSLVRDVLPLAPRRQALLVVRRRDRQGCIAEEDAQRRLLRVDDLHDRRCGRPGVAR